MAGGALIVSWLFGVWHAWSAHSPASAAFALLIPPYGIYLASEQSFGHEARRPDLAAGEIAPAVAERLMAQCMRDGRRRFALNETQLDVFCACTVQSVVGEIPAGMFVQGEMTGEQLAALVAMTERAAESCRATARYMGRPKQRPQIFGD